VLQPMNNNNAIPPIQPMNFNDGVFQPMTVTSYSFNPNQNPVGPSPPVAMAMSAPGIDEHEIPLNQAPIGLGPDNVGYTVGQRDLKQRLNDREYHVDISGWVHESWEFFKRHWKFYILWGVLVNVIYIVGGRWFPPLYWLTVPLVGGLYVATFNLIRTTTTGTIQVRDFLQGFIKILPILAIHLLQILIIGAGFLALIIPGIYAAVVLSFPHHIYMEFHDEGIGIIDSLHISYNVVHKKFWKMFLFNLALYGIIILGGLALGIGVVVAVPVAFIASCIAFRDIFGLKDHHQYSLTNVEDHHQH